MNKGKLSTESYKGVRDFYPKEMALQLYIFNNWIKTAKKFGFEQYDASVLEPAELYKAKGAENEEMVNEQTYTFTDRGDREVTLRPEMTPTAARMIAGKKRDLSFPARWFSIPNLFRYERPQRGRLREHWQLNCDIFGSNEEVADLELISLAHQMMLDFGATEDMFEILINSRAEMTILFNELGINDEIIINQITRLNDRKKKISISEYHEALSQILNDESLVEKVSRLVNETTETHDIITKLRDLGINNAKIDRTIARGFNYYTGIVFELVDTSEENKRSMLGGGRYDNLTEMFGDEAIAGVGFGMGDVTMKDFLITHNLIPDSVYNTGPTVVLLPLEPEQNIEATKIAHTLRQANINVATNFSYKKLGKKISDANEQGVKFTIVVGNNELVSHTFNLKNLRENSEQSSSIEEIITLIQNSN